MDLKKGRFGITLSFAAMLSFLFTLLNQPLAVVLVCGFAVLAEKDEWLNHQALEALALSAVYLIVQGLLALLINGLVRVLGLFSLFDAQSFIYEAHNVINDLLYIAVIAGCIFAIVKVLKGKDAGLPLIKNIAAFALGVLPARKAAAPVGPVYTAPQAPVKVPAMAYAAPAQASAPQAVPAMNSSAEDGGWICGCGAHNSGRFCVACGKPRS